jgi:hypothetical protein
MPTRQVESTHEAEPNHPVPDQNAPGVESPSEDRMEGANGAMHAEPDPAAAGPGQSTPENRGNEDDATYGDQDIDTAGTAHDDLSPTKSM